jgi:5-methylcytosine-specific restriction endonuclease McrA
MRWVQRRALPSRVRQVTLASVSDRTYRKNRWKTLSETYRRTNPLCEACGLRLATEVHHVRAVNAAPEQAFDWSNLRALCRSCHHGTHQATRGRR